MAGFEVLFEKISMGILCIMDDAPTDRAFSRTFHNRVLIKQKAYDDAVSYGLIKQSGPDAYTFTPHGLHFRDYVKAKQAQEELPEDERWPLHASTSFLMSHNERRYEPAHAYH